MEKKWVRTRFGAAPFEKLVLLEFSFSGTKNPEDTAFAQYNLLLNEEVLQAHLDFETKQGKIVILPEFDLPKEMKKLGIEYKLIEETILPYERLLASNNTL